MVDPFKIPEITAQRVAVDPSVPQAARPSSSVQGKSFQDVLSESIGEVQRLQNEADATIKQLVSGELKDVTQAMVAIEQADVSFQTMMAVRNKMVAAYEEVMRMQV